jgi:hypothetical protein
MGVVHRADALRAGKLILLSNTGQTIRQSQGYTGG